MKPIPELHARIAAKKVLLGCCIESLAPNIAEMAGMLGFDLLWGDLEHMTGSPHQVEPFCIGAKAGGALPLVRVQYAERNFIMVALEAGARLVAVPMVESADTARRIVEYGKYRPLGNRGFAGSPRGLNYGIGSQLANTEWANRETHLFPQIETVKAVEHCREIIDVEGISGAVIGPSDLSFSMGKPLQFDDPELVKAFVHAVREVRSLNKIAIAVSGHPTLVRAALDAGVHAIICAGERPSLRAQWQQTLHEMREKIR